MPSETFAHQVDVQLLQLPAGSVAEPCEILSGADDVRERQRGLALDAARELQLQLVACESLACAATLPGRRRTDNPLYWLRPARALPI